MVFIVDGVIESIRIELEKNTFKNNQKRISSVRLLSELFNYRVIERTVVMDILYLLVRYGHDGNIPKPLFV